MKLHLLPALFCILASLASCAPIPTTLPPTGTPVPTATTVPPTERPHSVLREAAALFRVPDSAGSDPLAELPSGATVYPLGRYVDFVKAAALVAGSEVTGFIHKDAIGGLPDGLPELAAGDVPLTPMFAPACTAGADLPNGTLQVERKSNDPGLPISAAIPIRSPLRLRIGSLSLTGDPQSTFQLFGRFGTGDSWWQGLVMISIGSLNGHYDIFIVDGTRPGPTYDLGDLGLAASAPIQIVFEQPEGKSFQVLDGQGRQVRRVDVTQQPGLKLPDGLFPDGKLAVGPGLAPGSSLTITGLQIGSLPTGQWVETGDLYPGLAELAAKRHLTLGTEFSTNENMDAQYCRIMHRDFNVAILNSFSWKGTWLGPGQYDFSGLDQEVDYAVQQGWRVRGSHLVWGDSSSSIPDWLKNGHFTRDEYIGFLEEHVKTLAGRYKGRVGEWSIANEASSRSLYQGADFWNEKIGPEYIEMAFGWAREADPDAILIFNDANNEAPRDSVTRLTFDRMYKTVKALKSKGVPIDVVGMEMHLLLKYSSPIPPKKEDVLAAMRKFADLGVKIYITEFDVDLHNRPGTPEERLQFQAGLYRDMLEACLESQACESFSTWGVADATSWITTVCSDPWCINEPDGDPLMFDRDYNPKPAYFAVRDVLQNFAGASSP